MDIKLENYTNQEIRAMINKGEITEQDVVDYFNNEWWEDEMCGDVRDWDGDYIDCESNSTNKPRLGIEDPRGLDYPESDEEEI